MGAVPAQLLLVNDCSGNRCVDDLRGETQLKCAVGASNGSHTRVVLERSCVLHGIRADAASGQAGVGASSCCCVSSDVDRAACGFVTDDETLDRICHIRCELRCRSNPPPILPDFSKLGE